jgi:hypothetical protein
MIDNDMCLYILVSLFVVFQIYYGASDIGARSGSAVHMKISQSECSLTVTYVVAQFTCSYLLLNALRALRCLLYVFMLPTTSYLKWFQATCRATAFSVNSHSSSCHMNDGDTL